MFSFASGVGVFVPLVHFGDSVETDRIIDLLLQNRIVQYFICEDLALRVDQLGVETWIDFLGVCRINDFFNSLQSLLGFHMSSLIVP